MRVDVNTSSGNTPKTITENQQSIQQASGAAAMALGFLKEIQEVNEQVHGLAVSARMYMQSQDQEPDFFVLNFFNVIANLLESNELFMQARQYLQPVAGEGAE